MSLEERADASSEAGSADKNTRGLPNRLRRQPKSKSLRCQPKSKSLRFVFPVSARLDAETFETLEAVSLQRRYSRGTIIENIVREWAIRERAGACGSPPVGPADKAEAEAA